MQHVAKGHNSLSKVFPHYAAQEVPQEITVSPGIFRAFEGEGRRRGPSEVVGDEFQEERDDERAGRFLSLRSGKSDH